MTGERAEIVRRTDNLTVGGGEFGAPRSPTAPAAGERAAPVRPQDNLRMEGQFSGQWNAARCALGRLGCLGVPLPLWDEWLQLADMYLRSGIS